MYFNTAMIYVTKHINKSILQEVTIKLEKIMKNNCSKEFKREANRLKDVCHENKLNADKEH